jgi:hypothetical protein
MSVIARKAIDLLPNMSATVEGWTCATCAKAFGLVTIQPIADALPEPTQEIPRYCPNCGLKFDRWVP